MHPWWWALLAVAGFGAAILWWRRGGSKPTDIKPLASLDPDLHWDKPEESLRKVYDYVVAVSDDARGWYQSRRKPKKKLGFSLRLGALALTVAAGLVPLSSIPPKVSTVMLAIAGLFVSFDALAGHTSGWVRYMLAQQKIERAHDAFVMEWNALRAAKTDAATMLDRAKTFLLAVGKIVDDETQDWAAEFQSALKEMDKARRAAAEAERGGAIEVTVKNAKAVTEWTLEIDGNLRGSTSGKNLAVTDVPVGLRKLKAYGQDPQGKRLSDEKTVKVEAGATVAKEFELS
jgi:hypothetical protein